MKGIFLSERFRPIALLTVKLLAVSLSIKFCALSYELQFTILVIAGYYLLHARDVIFEPIDRAEISASNIMALQLNENYSAVG